MSFSIGSALSSIGSLVTSSATSVGAVANAVAAFFGFGSKVADQITAAQNKEAGQNAEIVTEQTATIESMKRQEQASVQPYTDETLHNRTGDGTF